MEKEGVSSVLIEKKQIANGMTVSFFDRSRPVAGDRCMAQLTCEAMIPISGELWESKKNEDPDLLSRIRESMRDTLVFSVGRTRNFVPTDERQAAISELIQQIEENMMAYLSDPKFPQKLFSKQYEETREKILIEARRRHMTGQTGKGGNLLDFSAYARK